MSTINGRKNIIEWPNIEQSSFGRGPAKLVFTASSHYERVQHIEKWGKEIYLPDMHRSNTNESL